MLDLCGREVGAVRRHDDGGAQPRVAIQPLGGDPVVDGAAERRRQVLAEHDLRAVEHVADGEARLKRLQHVVTQLFELLPGGPHGGRQSGRPLIGALAG